MNSDICNSIINNANALFNSLRNMNSQRYCDDNGCHEEMPFNSNSSVNFINNGNSNSDFVRNNQTLIFIVGFLFIYMLLSFFTSRQRKKYNSSLQKINLNEGSNRRDDPIY